MKIIIIYDSKTGNTEAMAKAIADGVANAAEVEVKKIGDSFPLSILADADGIAFGSPVIYADITNEMKDFLEHLEQYIKLGKMNINNCTAAIFGSYGYDGAWIMSELFKARVKEVGYNLFDEVFVLVDSNIKYHTDEATEKCKEFGKRFAESL